MLYWMNYLILNTEPGRVSGETRYISCCERDKMRIISLVPKLHTWGFSFILLLALLVDNI